MGRKKTAGVSNASQRKAAQRASKFEQLTALNDKLLAASALTPAAKELEASCQQIWDLVQQIRSLQAEDSDGVKAPRESKISRFLSWCKERGVQGDKVELAMFDKYEIGLRATQKIQHHEMFLNIPRSMMMTADLETSPIGNLLKTDPIASRMANIELSLFLLAERFNKSSQWKAYIDILPTVYNTPLYFTPEEITLLKGSSTYDQSVGMQRSIARQYSYFWSLFINQSDKYPSMAKHFTYDMYRWAVSTVMTRQNVIPAAKQPGANASTEQQAGSYLALIPFWDMCNHKQGEMLTDYDDDLNECHCYANTVVEPGDQVFICYSMRPNSDFLVHNGFVYEDNPNDTVLIRLGLAKTDPFINTRRNILARYGMPGDVQIFFLCKQADNLLPDDLFTFLRVFNASEDEMKALADRESGDDTSDVFQPISQENDKKCWTYLKVRCSLLLRTYTWECAHPNFDQMNVEHVAMAKSQVIGEKELLNRVINLCDSKLEV